MGVGFADFGGHKNVYTVRFDQKDIFYSIGGSTDGRAVINFYTNDNYEGVDFLNKPFKDTPFPEASIVFDDPAQINGLVIMLLQLQKEYFK